MATTPVRSATADAPPLDLPDDGLLGAIVRLNLAVTHVLEDVAHTSGLTFSDYLVLGVVRRSPGQRSSPTAIATVLGRTTGGTTLTLDRLATAGMDERECYDFLRGNAIRCYGLERFGISE